MKKILLLTISSSCFLFLAFFIFHSTAHAATIGVPQNFTRLNSGLVGWWTMDGRDVVNGVALDKSGNGNTGKLTNIATSTFYKPGKIGQGFNFDGVNDSISIPHISAVTSAGNYTMSLWLKPSNVFSQSGSACAIDISNSSTNVNMICIVGGSVYGGYYNGSFTTKAGSIAVNKWTHVVYVNSAGTITVYVNNVSVSGSPTNVGDSNEDSIGADVGGGLYYKGLMDDVRIYNRALSAQEVTDLYNMGAATKFAVSRTGSSSPLTNGLVGYWTFDGKDVVNGVAKDRSGNGNDGKLLSIASSTFYVPGKIGQGFKFDGVDDEVSNTTLFSGGAPSAITWSAWVKWRSFPNANVGIIGKSDGAGQGVGFVLEGGSTLARPVCIINSTSATPAANTVSTNKWYFVTCVWDGSTVYTYVDAVQKASASVSSITNSSFNLRMGQQRFNTQFPGSLDDVRIYSRALSVQEITDLYNMGAATKLDVSKTGSSTPLSNGLVGYWTFDGKDVVNGVAKDRSGNGNDGNLISIATSTFYAPGKIGQGFNFDGTVGNSVTAGNTSSLSITTGTVSAWVYITRSASRNTIVSKYNFSTGRNGYMFYTSDTGSGAQFKLALADGSSGQTFTGGVNNSFNCVGLICTPALNSWHHVVASWDGTNVKFYLDGRLDPTVQSAQTVVPVTNVNNFTIGQDAVATNSNFGGKIDDVRIYSRALSAQEVGQLYNMGR